MRFQYFTDGSRNANGTGSWAWVEKTSKQSEVGVSETYTTSMRMELFALLHAMQHALSNVSLYDKVYFFTDCKNMVTLLNQSLDIFYRDGANASFSCRDNDLWLEIISTSLLLDQACFFEVIWISRKLNNSAHLLAYKAFREDNYLESYENEKVS